MFKRNKLKAEAEAKRLQLEEEYKKAQERREEIERDLAERLAARMAEMEPFVLYSIDDLNAGDEGFWLNLSGYRIWPHMIVKVKIITKAATIKEDGSVVKYIELCEDGWSGIARYWETDGIYFCKTEDEVRSLATIYCADAFKKHIKEETEKLNEEYTKFLDTIANWTWPGSDAPQKETN